MMTGSVTSWKMTEDERLAYIAKHPIRPTKEAEKRSSPLIGLITSGRLLKKQNKKARITPGNW
ncbi:hypothetical protein [Mesobacillus zeae]|uniref:Uncharacterized protein n=1 Tax=Mesobacillus zeae TaxID=1917180 RepID=A0A398B6H7_9BACI|nr:hypothetical protein [Mesobacillus zeae]RID85064.1 hypothetical protein D1970_10890 [Mesobacillus zeae]